MSAPMAPEPPPNEIYGIFCGPIDQPVLSRIFRHLAETTTRADHPRHVHILFQSTGGTVGDCICLYNLFRGYPLDLTLYNVGAIQSGAVTSYLGARRRKTCAHAQFMIHRSHCSPQHASLNHLEAAVESLRFDDARTEAILRAHTRLPERAWSRIREGDVFLSAAEAIDYGLADEIGDFAPPPGAQIYFL
jgi:ATP-dependent Clp protease protease subunit